MALTDHELSVLRAASDLFYEIEAMSLQDRRIARLAAAGQEMLRSIRIRAEEEGELAQITMRLERLEKLASREGRGRTAVVPPPLPPPDEDPTMAGELKTEFEHLPSRVALQRAMSSGVHVPMSVDLHEPVIHPPSVSWLDEIESLPDVDVSIDEDWKSTWAKD